MKQYVMLLALLCIFWFSLSGCEEVTGNEQALAPKNFTVESGPDEIGWSQIWVIRHNQSGERFVFMERGSGGIFLTPLKSHTSELLESR